MASPAQNDESGGTSADNERRRYYCMPLDLTTGGRTAFDNHVSAFAARLAQQLEVDAQLAHNADPEYTAEHVSSAVKAIRRQVGEQDSGAAANRAVAATLLVTLGSAGSGILSGNLNSDWQLALFAIFALIGIAGLVLAWTSRPRRPGGG